MWDNGGRDVKLGPAKFIDTGLLGRDSSFNVVARVVCLVN